MGPGRGDIYGDLEQRVGPEHLQRRLRLQVELAASFYAHGARARFHLENIERIPVVLALMLKALGLYRRGRVNSLAFRLERPVVRIHRWPAERSGFRILQLSDIHADGLIDGGKRLEALLSRLRVDLCVWTGDFRFLTQDHYDTAMTVIRRLLARIRAPGGHFGILGNHDFIEFVAELEASGIRILLNEAVAVDLGRRRFWLAGIDDAHLYGCHDLDKALHGIPSGEPVVLLSHTPETYLEAAARDVDYMLCGHTHGGQICLPGGVPIITNARCPRRYCAGRWRYRRLKGYTSRGTGSSGLAVRFCCPPEITLHEIQPA
jgi:uncharacterized protein